ncbi:MAG TPA: hypothetical protein VKA70_09390 [Blastocatellia bacterium]|nr:hypothetical protein [Blastocatellia bacterium]
MRIRPDERQIIADIFREESEEATRRIAERLSAFECRPVSGNEDTMESIRRFYEELADSAWTEADEEALGELGDWSEHEVKQMLRESFRRSPVFPPPSFSFLVNLHKRDSPGTQPQAAGPLSNPDAVSALERERIANLLHSELEEAAREIARRLRLEGKADIVREELQRVEGNIISRFTPLV